MEVTNGLNRVEDFKSRGTKLIEELKDHIRRVVESEGGKTHWSLGQIEKASGLMIISKTGQNVWDMAVATLVIELVKDRIFQSDIPEVRLNTKSAATALFWLRR